MARPLVTIISPTYDQERFVAECVESALAQTYPEWEQIVVDDGSSDHTREIVASYGDPRIRVLALPHRGLGALAESYNAALAASTGSLVGILEGDDRWPSDKLERQVPLFDDPRTFLSWGRATTVDGEGRPMGERATPHPRGRVATLSTAAGFRRLTRSNLFTPSVTVMVRRDALNAVRGFTQRGSGLFVDLPTWLHVTAVLDGQVSYLDRVLGIYRVHPGQTTRAAGAEMSRQHLQAVLSTLQSLDESTLARLGWNADLQRRVLARGHLVEGEVLLAAARYGDAAAAFRDAFGQCADLPDRLLALGGLASALLRADLVAPAFALRARVRQRLRRD